MNVTEFYKRLDIKTSMQN